MQERLVIVSLIKGAIKNAIHLNLLMTLLSIDDLPDIKLISFNTSSTVGSFRILITSMFWISIQTIVGPIRVDIRDKMFADIF